MIELMDLETAIEEEASLPPGTYEVRFYLTEPLSAEEIEGLREQLGSPLDAKIYQRPEYLGVRYTRYAASDGISVVPGMAVVGLIGLAIAGFIIGITILNIEKVTNLILVGGGILLVLFALARKPATKYIEAKYSR